MKFRPLADRILAVPERPAKESRGGILIPDGAGELQGQSRKALVVTVGPEVNDVKANDVIIIGKFIGLDYDDEGIKMLIIPEDDVLGVVED